MKKNLFVSLLCVLSLFAITACTSQTTAPAGQEDQTSEPSQQSGEANVAIEDESEDGEETEAEEQGDDEQIAKPFKQLTGNPASNKAGTVIVEITSPEESTFVPGQARMWQAEIKADDYFADDEDGTAESEAEAVINSLSTEQFKYQCVWNFVLNGEDYHTQELYPAFYAEDTGFKTCGFTTTAIGREGKLEASVTLSIFETETVFDEDGNFVENKDVLLDTITATEDYTVKR